jgi:ubiquinone/menaquinone biosynthesis C-methylase UbiE
MHDSRRRQFRLVWILWLVASFAAPLGAAEQAKPEDINAKFRNPDVVQSIRSFEGESREIFQKRDEILAACDLRAGIDVADVGAGTGLFTRLFASRVAPGKVYAVDISQKFIEHIEKTCRDEKLDNVQGIVCGDDSTELPANSVDLVFVCDTYHHFQHPEKNLASIRQALRPGGRLVVVEFEKEQGVTPEWIMKHVRPDRETAIREITSAGFRLLDQPTETMKGQYVLRFAKSE